MKCSRSGCSRTADKECVECEQSFCSQHVETCGLCQGTVCHDCREAHQSNPLHIQDTPSA